LLGGELRTIGVDVCDDSGVEKVDEGVVDKVAVD
jgi:hypothetical protein